MAAAQILQRVVGRERELTPQLFAQRGAEDVRAVLKFWFGEGQVVLPGGKVGLEERLEFARFLTFLGV